MKLSFEEARRLEAVFFKNTPPWCNRPELADRMGTPNLTKALSKLLGAVINDSYEEYSLCSILV